jgi:hypothetical protein
LVLNVETGGVCIAIGGLSPSLWTAARARYARFLVDAAPAMRLQLSLVENVHEHEVAPLVEPRGARGYAIHYHTVEAELDCAAGTGRATVADNIYGVDSLLRITTTLLLLERGALLLHASGVRNGGRALVCFGPSGSGKTTVASSVPPGDVLCDEMVALHPGDGAVRAFGTPFHGDLPVCAPRALPLGALVRLRHGSEDRLTRLGGAAAVRELLGSVLFFARDEATVERLLHVAERACAPGVYELTSRKFTHVPSFIERELGGRAVASGA